MARILFANQDLYPPPGGAGLSMLPVLAALVRAGHQVQSVNSGAHAGILQERDCDLDGVRARVTPRWLDHARAIMDSERPGLVVTQGWGCVEILELARERRIPTALFVVDLIQLTDQPYCPDNLDYERAKHAFALADLVIANSHFTRHRLKEIAGIEARVAYPVIHEEDYRVTGPRSPEFALLASGLMHKGSHWLVEQAPAVPIPCAVCGPIQQGDEEVLARTPNLKYLGLHNDMRPVYARTRCLLLLSQFDETFGRVIIEAQLNGIPVVAHDKGAVREVAGKAAVYVQSSSQIPGAVARALKIPPGLCLENASRFSGAGALETAVSLVQSLVP